MMTTARKSFALSLAFHTLMGSLAFLVLSQMNEPPKISRIPFKIMSLSPAEHRISIPLPETAPTPPAEPVAKVVPTPEQPITKPLTPPTVAPQSVTVQPAPPQASAPTAIAPVPKAISTPQPVVVTTPIAIPKAETKPDISAAKKAFFNSLRNTIQNHLRYPSAARRRGMEGEVGIRFTLLSNGNINAVSIQRGEGIFHSAALAAVNAASGVDIPKNLIESLPLEIELTLEFKLNS